MGRETVHNVGKNFERFHSKATESFHHQTKHEKTTRNSLRESVVFVLLAFFTAATFKILETVTEVQPSPFIDEICHIPQAQEYCRGNFTYWDQRITTLPGLYLLSVGVLRPLSLWRESFLCSSFNLRLTNVVLSACNFLLYVWIVDRLHNGKDRWKRLLSAVNLAIFPPLYFFSFLYYTDVAATCLLLQVLVLHLSGHNVFAAFTAIISILMRQTNIVWTFFCATRAIDILLRKYLIIPADNTAQNIHTWQQILVISKGLLQFPKQSWKRWADLATDVLKSVLPYAIVGILFAAFVMWNGGLVVGDRSAHIATVHIPQLFYYFGFGAFFCFPHFLQQVKPFLRTVISRWFITITTITLITVIVHYNTMTHPYLLSDNRHYTFYVWMRFFEHRAYGRYIFWPVYMFGAFCVYRTVQRNQSFLVTMAFFLCCTLALVPQKLLECRYFIAPFILMRLNVKPESWIPLLLENLMYVAINATTIYLFLEKPFPWPNMDELQRIIW